MREGVSSEIPSQDFRTYDQYDCPPIVEMKPGDPAQIEGEVTWKFI
jgi:hypothetical protein